jgi:hypothetical protein
VGQEEEADAIQRELLRVRPRAAARAHAPRERREVRAAALQHLSPPPPHLTTRPATAGLWALLDGPAALVTGGD